MKTLMGKVGEWYLKRDVSTAEARTALTIRGWAQIVLWAVIAASVAPYLSGWFSFDTFAIGGTYLTITLTTSLIVCVLAALMAGDGAACLFTARIGRRRAKDEADTAFFVCEDHMHLASTAAVVHVGDDECDGQC